MTDKDDRQQTADGRKPRLTLASFAEQTNARFEELTAMIQQKPKSNATHNLYWLIAVLLILYGAVFIVPHLAGIPLFAGKTAVTQKTLAMNQAEYNLFQSAVSLVLNDLDQYNSVGTALTSLYSELPDTIRDKVIERLGSVKNVNDLPEALQSLLGRVIVVGAVEAAGGRKQATADVERQQEPTPPPVVRIRRR